MKTFLIASDHAGFALKAEIQKLVKDCQLAITLKLSLEILSLRLKTDT